MMRYYRKTYKNTGENKVLSLRFLSQEQTPNGYLQDLHRGILLRSVLWSNCEGGKETRIESKRD